MRAESSDPMVICPHCGQGFLPPDAAELAPRVYEPDPAFNAAKSVLAEELQSSDDGNGSQAATLRAKLRDWATVAVFVGLPAVLISIGLTMGWQVAGGGFLLLVAAYCGIVHLLERSSDWLNHRRGTKSAALSLEVENDAISMGGPVLGQVVLAAKQPLRGCRVLLSLDLWVDLGIWSGSDREFPSNLAFSSNCLTESDIDLSSNESRVLSFKFEAPTRSRRRPGAVLGSMGMRAKRMDEAELLKKYKTHWTIMAELIGGPGEVSAQLELPATVSTGTCN